MMVKCSSTLVEPPGVPRVGELEQLKIEMVAEFVAECAQKRAERGDFLPNRGTHPQPDEQRFRVVIAEQLGRPIFADTQRSSGKDADTTSRCSIELSGFSQKLRAGTADISHFSRLHGRLDGFRNVRQPSVLRQVESVDSLALQETCPVPVAGWGVSDDCGHGGFIIAVKRAYGLCCN